MRQLIKVPKPTNCNNYIIISQATSSTEGNKLEKLVEAGNQEV